MNFLSYLWLFVIRLFCGRDRLDFRHYDILVLVFVIGHFHVWIQDFITDIHQSQTEMKIDKIVSISNQFFYKVKINHYLHFLQFFLYIFFQLYIWRRPKITIQMCEKYFFTYAICCIIFCKIFSMQYFQELHQNTILNEPWYLQKNVTRSRLLHLAEKHSLKKLKRNPL